MSIRQAPTGDFETDLTQLLPRLRVYALSLTRNSVRADDLVQQTVLRSLAGRKSFRPGTNFPGWLFRIQRNEFISGLRRERPTVELNDAISSTLLHAQRQESGIVMREFKKAFRTLAGDQRHALLLTALAGHSHERIAGACRRRGRHGEEQGLARSRSVEGDARPRGGRLRPCRAAARGRPRRVGRLIAASAGRHGHAPVDELTATRHDGKTTPDTRVRRC